MRTLVLCDDYWHPARTPRAGLGQLEDADFAFDWIEHAGEWSGERMAEYPLVILTKANNISSADKAPRAGHPLADGSAPFTLVDEHYHMDLEDVQADVFLTTTSEHGEQPGGWTRIEGAGRVCVLTPGHNLEVWLHPSYQSLIRNALRWCGGMARR